MKKNEKKSTNHQPSTQKPFFGAPHHAFFSPENAQPTPFFQPKAVSPLAIQAKSATSEAEDISQTEVQRMPAFESEVTSNGQVQRKLINSLQQSLASPIQASLTIGAPGDKYEIEADRVASQVVEQINAPASTQSTQGQSVQLQEEKKEELQTKPEITALQRQEENKEELQTKPEISVLQHQEENKEELQTKPEITVLQRQEENKEELQAKSNLQHGEASTDLASAINNARGSGQPLDVGLQQSMGQAMGADFSGVRVHTDAQSDQLNQSIQAKAFTTGQDVFFRQGAYQPGSRGGQELIAHELTHVVQQREKTSKNPSQKKSEAKEIQRFIYKGSTKLSLEEVQEWYKQQPESKGEKYQKEEVLARLLENETKHLYLIQENFNTFNKKMQEFEESLGQKQLKEEDMLIYLFDQFPQLRRLFGYQPKEVKGMRGASSELKKIIDKYFVHPSKWAVLHSMREKSFERLCQEMSVQKPDEVFKETKSKYYPTQYQEKRIAEGRHVWSKNYQWLEEINQKFAKLVLTAIPLKREKILRIPKSQEDIRHPEFSALARELAYLLLKGAFVVSGEPIKIGQMEVQYLEKNAKSSGKRVKIYEGVLEKVITGDATQIKIGAVMATFRALGIACDEEDREKDEQELKEYREGSEGMPQKVIEKIKEIMQKPDNNIKSPDPLQWSKEVLRQIVQESQKPETRYVSNQDIQAWRQKLHEYYVSKKTW